MSSSVRVQREGLSCLTLEHYLQKTARVVSLNGSLGSFLFLFIIFFREGGEGGVMVRNS